MARLWLALVVALCCAGGAVLGAERRQMGEVLLSDLANYAKETGKLLKPRVELKPVDPSNPTAHLDVTHLVKDLSDHEHPEHPAPKDAHEVHEAATQPQDLNLDHHNLEVTTEHDPTWSGEEKVPAWRVLADARAPSQPSSYWRGHKDAHDTYVVPRLLAETPPEIGAHHGQLIRGHAYSHRRMALEWGTSPAPIRIKAFYDPASIALLPADKANFLKTQVMPKAISYLESILMVRNPVVGALKLPKKCTGGKYYQVGNKIVYDCAAFTDTCIDGYIPEEHFAPYAECQNVKYNDCTAKPGGAGVIDADYVLYVSAAQSAACPYCTEGASCDGTIAYAGACITDSGTDAASTTDRPLAGGINFCPGKIDTQSNLDVQVAVAVHEIIHSMGFSSFSFPWWRDESNAPRTPRDIVARPVKDNAYYTAETTLGSFVESGVTRSKIVTPKVRAAAASHFGCPDINGLEIEDDGGAGTAGSHWEERVMNGDTMVGYSHPDSVVSPMTLALLEDTGWYIPDYNKAGWLDMGRSKGCPFLTDKCAKPLQAAFQGVYCEEPSNSKQCTRDFSGVGVCSSPGSFAFDDCVAVVPYSNRDCSNPLLQNVNLTKWGWNYGPSSLCIGVSNVVKISNHAGQLLTRTNQGAMCAKMVCRKTLAGQSQLYVALADNNEVLCNEGQWTSFANTPFNEFNDHFLQGELDCPASSESFCNSFAIENDGKVGCPSACNGRGDCVAGVCSCFPGFNGESCGNGICTNPDFVCPSGSSCNRATGVCDAEDLAAAAQTAEEKLTSLTTTCNAAKAAADACTADCGALVNEAAACEGEIESYQSAYDAAAVAANAGSAAASAANAANEASEAASSAQQNSNAATASSGTPTPAQRTTTGGTPCKLPFSGAGQTYYDCTTDLFTDGNEYCLIENDNRLFPCAPALTAEEARQKELALRGEFARVTTKGEACVLPFYVGGKEYTDCTTDRSSGCEWCMTGVGNNNRIKTGCCDPERVVEYPEADAGEPCKWPVEYPSGSGQRYRDCSADLAPSGQSGEWCVYEKFAGSYQLGRCKPLQSGDVGYEAPASQVSGMTSVGEEADDDGDGEATTQATLPGYTPVCAIPRDETKLQHSGHLYHTCPVSLTLPCDQLYASTTDVYSEYTGNDGEQYSYSIPANGAWFKEAKPLQGNAFSGDWWTLPFRLESFLGVLTPFTDYAYFCVFDRLYRLEKHHLDYLRDPKNTNNRNIEVAAASYSSSGGITSLTKSFQYFIWLPPPNWVECYLGDTATDYRGHVAKTKTGTACLPWTAGQVEALGFTPQNYPDAGLGGHGYCRNPTNETNGAWCFTNATYPAKNWDFCDVGPAQPRCWFESDDSDNTEGTGTCSGGSCDDLGAGAPDPARRRALRRRLLSGEDGNAQVASKDLTPTKGLDDPQMVVDIVVKTSIGGAKYVLKPDPDFNGKRALYGLTVLRAVSALNFTVDVNKELEGAVGGAFYFNISASAPPPTVQDLGAGDGGPGRLVGVYNGTTVTLAGTGATTIHVTLFDARGNNVPASKVYTFVVSYAASTDDGSAWVSSFSDAVAPTPSRRLMGAQ